MPSRELSTISAQPDCSIKELMRQRLIRLAECIRKDGAPYPVTPVLVNVWIDVFVRSQITPQQVNAAFEKAERRIRFWPSPGEVLELIEHAKENAGESEAAQKWEVVLAYALQRSPDYADKHAPRILPRTQQAINAAGELDWIRDCDAESLTWARKRFIESYVRWGELQQDQYLLPDGEIKNLVKEAARKLLPPSRSVADTAKYKLVEEQAKQIEAKQAAAEVLP